MLEKSNELQIEEQRQSDDQKIPEDRIQKPMFAFPNHLLLVFAVFGREGIENIAGGSEFFDRFFDCFIDRSAGFYEVFDLLLQGRGENGDQFFFIILREIILQEIGNKLFDFIHDSHSRESPS